MSKLHLKISSITQFHREFGLPSPKHPMISLIDFKDFKMSDEDESQVLMANLYMIAIKKDFNSKMKYGQNDYDFDEGVMSFIAPNQLLKTSKTAEGTLTGKLLLFHPDFLNGFSTIRRIKQFGFFSYSLNEALYLSADEEQLILGTMQNIQREYESNIDTYSQDVMISHLDVLLNYANRFYNRQFITRKLVNNDLLSKLEDLLENYFEGVMPQNEGLPSVNYVAEQLNVSPNYLSDLLKSLTGKTTLQHIHLALMAKAKEYLSTTSLTVSEISFLLGFEHSQSFSKIFKQKMDVSPLGFRKEFL